MDKKSWVIVSIALVLLGAGWGAHLLSSKSPGNPGAQTTANKPKVVEVDEVVSSPEKFDGVIGVEGTVTKVDEPNSAFTLGCEDACIVMPVKFKGQLPKEGTNVIAFGEVKKTEQDKYVFVAQELRSR